MEPVKLAIPTDPLQKSNQWFTSDQNFCATCLLNPNVRLVSIEKHPSKIGINVFYLEPALIVQQMWFDYRNNNLRVDSRSLMEKVHELRGLIPVQLSSNTCTICGFKSSFNLDGMCEKCAKKYSRNKFGEIINLKGGDVK